MFLVYFKLEIGLKMNQNTKKVAPRPIKKSQITPKINTNPVPKSQIPVRPNTVVKKPASRVQASSPAAVIRKPTTPINPVVIKKAIVNPAVIKKAAPVISNNIIKDLSEMPKVNNENISFSVLQISEIVQDTYEILMKNYESNEQKQEINNFVQQFKNQTKMIFAKEKIENDDIDVIAQMLKEFNENLSKFLSNNSLTYNEADIFVRIKQLEDKVKNVESNKASSGKGGGEKNEEVISSSGNVAINNKINSLEKKINQFSDKLNILEKKLDQIHSEIQIITNAGHIQANQVISRVKILENYYIHLQNIITNLNQIITSDDITDLKKQMQNIIAILKKSNHFSDRG